MYNSRPLELAWLKGMHPLTKVLKFSSSCYIMSKYLMTELKYWKWRQTEIQTRAAVTPMACPVMTPVLLYPSNKPCLTNIKIASSIALPTCNESNINEDAYHIT